MSLINNTMRVKETNQELVRQALRLLNQGTKSMVAQATGLSIATCNNLLNELLATGELLELEMEESGGGRPARLYSINMNFSFVICIIIRAGINIHTLSYTVANLEGKTIQQGAQDYERLEPQAIYQLVDDLIEQFPQIKAIGIGVPGAVNQGIINVCDIKELVQVPLVDTIQEKHGIEVIVENDMNLTVYGFYQKQAYASEKSVVVAAFIPGCYPGSGIMVDGNILKGNTNFAGEIAFLPYGISLEEQYRQLHDKASACLIVGHAISSIIALINPETVAITGDLINADDVASIRQECLKYIPEMHLPSIILLEHPEETYNLGLITMTLESLASSLRLVDRRKVNLNS